METTHLTFLSTYLICRSLILDMSVLIVLSSKQCTILRMTQSLRRDRTNSLRASRQLSVLFSLARNLTTGFEISPPRCRNIDLARSVCSQPETGLFRAWLLSVVYRTPSLISRQHRSPSANIELHSSVGEKYQKT